MDEVDYKLLRALCGDARLSFRALSQQVHLTPPAVANRVAQLEQSGVLCGYRAKLDPERCGYPLTALISLSMAPAREAEFADFVAGRAEVWDCWHVAGPFAMVLRAGFADTRAMDRFVKLLQTFGKTQTQIIFSAVKEAPVLPAPQAK